MPARIISVYGTEGGLDDAGPRSSIRPSDASTKNAGDPKYSMKPALLIRRPIMHQRQGMAELVGVRQDEAEGEQDQGVERRVTWPIEYCRRAFATRKATNPPSAKTAVKTTPARVKSG